MADDSREELDAPHALIATAAGTTAPMREHWTHLRTSNPIESIFAGVRLRTNAAKRMRVRENALYLVFKLVTRLSLNWRAINGPNQLLLLLAGEGFVDGKLRRQLNTEGLAA